MSMFLVKHQHTAETCPAGHPQMGPMLLQHLSAPSARQFGVNIHSEAVVDGAHTLYLIVDADDPARVDEFMAPFAQAGTVEVLPASPCEAVVALAELHAESSTWLTIRPHPFASSRVGGH